MNKLSTNLQPIIQNLQSLNKLVSLRLSNNELGTKEHIQLIKSLIKEHTSLTALDLGNDDSSQFKNKLGNSGFEAVLEGIMDSETTVLSMLNVAQNNILSTFPETFNLLRAMLTMKSEQLIVLNLNDNELGPEFLSIIGHTAI